MIVQPSAMQRVAEAVQPPIKAPPAVQLHAPDKPGEIAHAAAILATGLQINLTIARSPTVELPARVAALEKVFTAWPALCREMAALSEVAPKSAAIGRRRAADARDFIESRGEGK